MSSPINIGKIMTIDTKTEQVQEVKTTETVKTDEKIKSNDCSWNAARDNQTI